MSLVPSLLQAIVHVDGEALVMHAGDKPYVVTPNGQVELATRGLALDAINGIVRQLLPSELQHALDEFGAVQHELPAQTEFPGEHFTVVAARGGDDVWVEVRRRQIPEDDAIPDEFFAPPQEAAKAQPYPVYASAGSPALRQAVDEPLPDALDVPSAIDDTEPPPSLKPVEPAGPPTPVAVAAPAPERAGAEPTTAAFEPPQPQPVATIPAPEPVLEMPSEAPVLETPPQESFRETPPQEPVMETPARESVPEPPTPEPVMETALSEPVLETTPEPMLETPDDEPVWWDLPAPESILETLLPEPVLETAPPEPEPVLETPEPEPVLETPEPEPVLETPEPEPVLETSEPEPVLEMPEPEPALETPEPQPAVETEVPEPVLEMAAPEPVAETPLPQPIAETPRPQPIVVEAPPPPPIAMVPAPEPIEPPAAPQAVATMPPPTSSTTRVEAPPSPIMSAAPAPMPVVEAQPPVELHMTGEAQAPQSPAPPRDEVITDQPSMETTPSPTSAVVLPMTRNPIRAEHPMPPADGSTPTGLDRLLRVAAARGASTLYLSSESRASVRVDGEMQALEGEPVLTSRDVESLLLTLMPERSHEALRTGAATEWILDIEDVGRVRCMSFRDHRGPGGVFRLMPTRSVSAEQLGLPRAVQGLAIEPEGLVLFAGPRSSGKRTLISAFVDLINRTRRDHVITLEREINIVHERGSSFISQREVRGSDEDMLAAARAALREDPDVLVIEDLRTAELVTVALEAAQSGHLVVSGFAAHTATAAVDRIIDLYAPEHRRQVQFALADTLRGVVAQVLLRKQSGGRVAAREVLLNTPAVSSVIAEGKTSQLPMAIEGGRRYGMLPLNDGLVSLVQSGVVDGREAYRFASDRPGLLAALKRQGVDTSFVEKLA